jgi:hypothetical protein
MPMVVFTVSGNSPIRIFRLLDSINCWHAAGDGRPSVQFTLKNLRGEDNYALA